MSGLLRVSLVLALSSAIAPPLLEARTDQDAAPASAIKAAFLYNFAKFVEWPPEARPGPLVLCVVDDPPVAEALESMVRGRTIERRELQVRRLRRDGQLRACHLLYAAGLDPETSREMVVRLSGAPVFSVSDGERFAARGGVAHLFRDGSRMRFAINPAAAHRARLRIHSQLLGLATIVKDEDVD